MSQAIESVIHNGSWIQRPAVFRLIVPSAWHRVSHAALHTGLAEFGLARAGPGRAVLAGAGAHWQPQLILMWARRWRGPAEPGTSPSQWAAVLQERLSPRWLNAPLVSRGRALSSVWAYVAMWERGAGETQLPWRWVFLGQNPVRMTQRVWGCPISGKARQPIIQNNNFI